MSMISPRDEAIYNPLLLQELSGIKQRLNTFAEPMARSPIAVAIPLYIYPSPGAWDILYDIITEHPQVNFDLVVNPANGPGGAVPDANYLTAVNKLNSYANTKIFGYVHVTWAARELEQVLDDITTWSTWADTKDYDVHVDGIFVDEAPADLNKLEYMVDISKLAKQLGFAVWTNPGVQVDTAFYEAADLVNSHENTYAGWQVRIRSRVESRSTIMIHTYDADDIEAISEEIWKHGYHSALITTSNCYTSFSRLLLRMVQAFQRLGKTG